MTILDLTFDYGPYAWLEDYNLDWAPNTAKATVLTRSPKLRYGIWRSKAMH